MEHTLIITNAFSLNMLPTGDWSGNLHIQNLTQEGAREYLKFWANITSAVGHESTAAILTEQLGVTIPMNRCNVVMDKFTTLLVGQYNGPRLQEGATSLPEGASIKWLLVEIN